MHIWELKDANRVAQALVMLVQAFTLSSADANQSTALTLRTHPRACTEGEVHSTCAVGNAPGFSSAFGHRCRSLCQSRRAESDVTGKVFCNNELSETKPKKTNRIHEIGKLPTKEQKDGHHEMLAGLADATKDDLEMKGSSLIETAK